MHQTTRTKAGSVTTWFDKISRNWVTQALNHDAIQEGDAIYTGHTEDAKAAHIQKVEESNFCLKFSEWVYNRLAKCLPGDDHLHGVLTDLAEQEAAKGN